MLLHSQSSLLSNFCTRQRQRVNWLSLKYWLGIQSMWELTFWFTMHFMWTTNMHLWTQQVSRFVSRTVQSWIQNWFSYPRFLKSIWSCYRLISHHCSLMFRHTHRTCFRSPDFGQMGSLLTLKYINRPRIETFGFQLRSTGISARKSIWRICLTFPIVMAMGSTFLYGHCWNKIQSVSKCR